MEITEELTPYEQFEKDSNKLQTKEGFTDWITGLRDAKNKSISSNQPISREASKILSWKEFKTRTYEEPKWIIENLIPEKGLVAIAGSPESCKSFFANLIAATVSVGELLLGKFKAEKTGVLILDQENLPSWIQRRLTHFITSDEIPLYIYPSYETPFNIEDDSDLSRIVSYVKENNIGLIIIDTLRLIHNRDENSSYDMKPVFDRLKRLTRITTVLFIHHNRKTDKLNRSKADGEDMMGSIFIRGALDSQLTLAKIRDVSDSVTRVRVTQTKARYTKPIQPFEITLEEINGKLEFIYQGYAVEEQFKKEDAKGIILLLLKDRQFTRQELINQLVSDSICGQRTADTALSELLSEEKISHTLSKPHLYSLIEPKNILQVADTYSDYKIAISDEEQNE